jgi:hypothetical protein
MRDSKQKTSHGKPQKASRGFTQMHADKTGKKSSFRILGYFLTFNFISVCICVNPRLVIL